MSYYTSCSWCHAINPGDLHFCRQCQHAAHLPRLECDCENCDAATAKLLARATSETRSDYPNLED